MCVWRQVSKQHLSIPPQDPSLEQVAGGWKLLMGGPIGLTGGQRPGFVSI